MASETESGPAPAAGDGAAADPGEAEAWAEVLAGWEDDARHRAYLARFPDLPGLAAAGGRYREALAARPDDPVAARWRDEVVRRAAAAGLASLPRTAPPAVRVPRWVLAVAVGGGLLALAGWGLGLLDRAVDLLSRGRP